jgi:signal transduction histidine kinase
MSVQEIDTWIRTRMFDEVPVSICVIDREFMVIEANRRFSEAYGSWQGRRCHSVYKGREDRCDSCAAVRTFADGQVRIREEQGIARGDRETYYLVHMLPVVRDGGGIPYLIDMSTDITPVKLLEKEKLAAERLAAVGETVAGIAHGIKNVVMALEGGMYVFNTGLQRGENERMAQGWKMLEDNIQRVSRFVREFLDFARGRAAHVAMTDPNRPAREVAELFAPRAREAGIELETDLQEGMGQAPLDAEGIHACLSNLVANAIDACAVSDRDREHRVRLTTREGDGVLEYEVSDNGTGMDSEISRRIFTTFFSTKASDKGTGLGLLTTRKIVQGHGGRITFDSKEGEGSVFRIELPRNRLPLPSPEKGKDGHGET